jgi:hypothetical protein
MKIFGDMRLANFKIDPSKYTRKYKGGNACFVKRKAKYEDIDTRIPLNFRPRKWIITNNQINTKHEFKEVNFVQNETKIIDEKIAAFNGDYDRIIDYLFNNWVIVQNLNDKISADTAVKIAMYAIFCAYKLKDIQLMMTIYNEQMRRAFNGFIILTGYFTMSKYSKTGLSIFKSRWIDENVQQKLEQQDEILEECNNEVKELFYIMKRKCSDYLYKANLMWESLIDSKQKDADKWFQCYAKVSKEFQNENWESCFTLARDTSYMMRNGNLRNNTLLMEIYIMGIEAGINMDNVDESFLREGMTIGIEIPGLAVRKLFYDFTTFSRTDKRYINSLDDKVNELLAQAKNVENRIIDRRLATNDIIEFRENRSWLIRCYELWLRTCRVKKLNPKVKIYTEMQNEYTNYFIEKEYDFKQDEEIIIGQLEMKESLAQETNKNYKI